MERHVPERLQKHPDELTKLGLLAQTLNKVRFKAQVVYAPRRISQRPTPTFPTIGEIFTYSRALSRASVQKESVKMEEALTFFGRPEERMRELLVRYYWINNMTQGEIASIFGVSKLSVLHWMRQFDVPTRSKTEARTLREERTSPKKRVLKKETESFSRDRLIYEKAKLTGKFGKTTERQLIVLQKLFEEKKSDSEIALQLGRTRSRAYQLRKDGIRNIQNTFPPQEQGKIDKPHVFDLDLYEQWREKKREKVHFVADLKLGKLAADFVARYHLTLKELIELSYEDMGIRCENRSRFIKEYSEIKQKLLKHGFTPLHTEEVKVTEIIHLVVRSLDIHILNMLARQGITTIAQLVHEIESGSFSVPRVGDKGKEQIRSALSKFNQELLKWKKSSSDII